MSEKLKKEINRQQKNHTKAFKSVVLKDQV